MAKNVYEGAPNSGDDWDSLSGALVAAGNGETITISGAWTSPDTANCTITNTNLTITATGESRHPGYVTNNSHYRLEPASGNSITVSATGATLDGLVIKPGSTSSDECIRYGVGNDLTLTDCILYSSRASDSHEGINGPGSGSAGVLTLVQCQFYQFTRAGLYYSSESGAWTININSCIFWRNGETGQARSGGLIIRNSPNGTLNIHNSVFVDNYTADGDDIRNEGTTGSTFNISYSMDSDNSIATVDGTGTGNIANATITDVAPGAGTFIYVNDISAAPYDLRLADSVNNDAQDAHAVATAETLTIPAIDIAGQPRPANTNYDLGPYELQGGPPPGPSIPPLAMHHQRQQR